MDETRGFEDKSGTARLRAETWLRRLKPFPRRALGSWRYSPISQSTSIFVRVHFPRLSQRPTHRLIARKRDSIGSRSSPFLEDTLSQQQARLARQEPKDAVFPPPPLERWPTLPCVASSTTTTQPQPTAEARVTMLIMLISIEQRQLGTRPKTSYEESNESIQANSEASSTSRARPCRSSGHFTRGHRNRQIAAGPEVKLRGMFGWRHGDDQVTTLIFG